MFDLFFPYSTVASALEKIPERTILAIAGAWTLAEVHKRHTNARVAIAKSESESKATVAALEVEALKLKLKLQENADSTV